MHCRMCSQRLTGPGKLCRECERELERARFAGVFVDAPAAAVPLVDVARMAGTENGGAVFERLRSPGSIIAAAFTVGLVGAIALNLAQRSNAANAQVSVMLDRDISGVHARSFAPAAHSIASEPLVSEAPARTTADVMERAHTRAPGSSGDDRPRLPAQRRVTLPVRSTSTAGNGRGASDHADRSATPARDAGPPAMAAASVSSEPSAGYDRVLAFSNALARCGGETFFARVSCEGRARTRYCAGAAQLPQCAEEFPSDHGQ